MDTDEYQEATFYVMGAAMLMAEGATTQFQLDQTIAIAERSTTIPKNAWQLQAQMITEAIRATEHGGP